MFEPQFFTLTSIYTLALLSPGQDFFLIVKHALTHGYKKAWWSCFGIASGNALSITLAYMVSSEAQKSSVFNVRKLRIET